MAMRNEEKDRRSRLYLFIVIIALLIVNGLLILNLFKKDKTIEETQVENTNLNQDIERLNSDLDALEMDLVAQKGKNQQLDSVIGVKERIIAEQVAQIRETLKRQDLSKSQIARLERRILELNKLVEKYETEVDSLSKLNEYLEDEVYAKDQEIIKHKKEKDEIASDLSKANIQLDIAKRLEAMTVVGSGIKVKSNGTEKELDKLNRIDKIKIGIVIDNNAVAEKETKTCYLQVITPEKSTLHNAQKGSGTFVYKGEKSLYTAKQNFDFKNSNEELIFYWDKSPAMTEGLYTANVYCEGILIGTTSFELR